MHKFSESLFQNAIDLNDTIVFEYNIDEDVISFSDNIKKYIPIPLRVSAFVKKMGHLGKVYDADLKKAIAFFTTTSDEDKIKMEYVRFLDFAGSFCWYQLKGRAEKSADGNSNVVYGTLCYVDDETKHRQEEEMAAKDPLTHLLNSDAFAESVKSYLEEIPNDVIPNIMLIDLDDFEDFISIHGEINGDGVLIEIGRILKRAFRGSDVIARLDEDRFAVMMKGVRAGNILLERSAYIRQTVKDVWSDFDNNGSLTVSIGVAGMHGSDATYDRLMGRAFSALNDAKNSGKDNFVLYTSENERLDTSINPILTSREMQMIKGILDPMCTWAYAVDDNYQLLYRNELLEERMPNEGVGLCYAQNKGYEEPCSDCPLMRMTDKDATFDCSVYSPSLRSSLPMRVNRIVMRNGKSVYIIASVKDNIESQIATMEEAQERVQDSLYEINDVIWDINVSKNLCVRIKEQNVGSFIDVRIDNYEKVRNHYADQIVYESDRKNFLECTDPKYIRQALGMGMRSIRREVRIRNIEGDYVWYGVNTKIISDYRNNSQGESDSQEDLRVMVVCENINDYKRHNLEEIQSQIRYEIMHEKSGILRDMSLSYERYENVNNMIGILVYEYDVASNEYYLCANFDDVFEVDRKNLTDEWALLEDLRCHKDDQEIFERFKENVRESTMVQKVTVRLYNRFGVPVWYTIYVQVLRGLNNAPVRFLGTLQNVNTEMRIKAEMEYRADFDSVTGLFNSETFYRKAGEKLHLQQDEEFVIISIDIDRFRLINDRYGIDAGNRTLQALGKVIKEVSGKGSLAKRFQSDMFTVMLSYESDHELVEYMTKLSAAIRDAKVLPMTISLTYGIYKVTDRNIPVRLMCDRARAVQKQVKSSALTNYAVYDDVIRLKLREQAEIEDEMLNALNNREFIMYLQPQVDIATGKMIGAEALVRWKHPIKGIMVPAQFLNLFESNGFITKMDMYIWEEACRYLKDLQERELFIPISVNISRIHIGKTDLSKILLGLTEQYCIAPEFLKLEITENLFMDDVDELFAEMDVLKNVGFKIMMDDFGSGYSSLNMLRNAPVDTLKIDRFFLDEIMSTDRGKIIVESSVRMAKQLGLSVIAEGVETKEQLDFLDSINCDVAQGYYFSRPIPLEEFEVFMKKYM